MGELIITSHVDGSYTTTLKDLFFSQKQLSN